MKEGRKYWHCERVKRASLIMAGVLLFTMFSTLNAQPLAKSIPWKIIHQIGDKPKIEATIPKNATCILTIKLQGMKLLSQSITNAHLKKSSEKERTLTLKFEAIKESDEVNGEYVLISFFDKDGNPESELKIEKFSTIPKVEIIKLDMVSNPIDPKHERYLGLSKWKTTPETSANEYACGEVGADIEIKCSPEDYEETFPFELTLDVNGDKKILHEDDYAGGEHEIELTERIGGKIGKYNLEAKWGMERIWNLQKRSQRRKW